MRVSNGTSGSSVGVIDAQGALKPYAVYTRERLDEIAARRPDVGAEAKQLFSALVADYRTRFSVDEHGAAAQLDGIVNELHDAVHRGEVDGPFIRLLDVYSGSDGFGAGVRDHATRLRSLFADDIARVTVELKPGPIAFPFALADGRTARFVGSVVKDHGLTTIERPRARVDGRDVLLTDDALAQVLGRMGHTFDASNSSRTKVFRTFLFGAIVPKAVHFDGEGFRMMKREDIDGTKLPDGARLGAGWRYYHDDSAAVGS